MRMSKWNYGDAYKRHPVSDGTVVFSDGSRLQTHDIFDPLPSFMSQADLLFLDPPWNLGNLNSFYTKADRDDYRDNFEIFYRRMFRRIGEIQPKVCYIEVGKDYLAEFIVEVQHLYKWVTFYNSTYYHRKDSLCYVIRGSNGRRKRLPLDGLDEEDIIKWVCANEEYECIGDLFMGLGLVAIHAYENGKKFVGTELNHKRLAVTVEELCKREAKYT